LIKGLAIKKINKRLESNSLNSTNTHWANISKYGRDKGWWLNIPFQKFSHDLNLILNHKEFDQFLHISIPASNITNPERLFRNKDELTTDIFISLPKLSILTSETPLIDIQSNGTKYAFSTHKVDVFESDFDISSSEFTLPDEITQPFTEGATKTITVNSYERNTKARKACIEKYGINCFVCTFDFEKFYGARGQGYIHVHHLTPISEVGKEYEIDPIKDLRPVCPNCHAMLHRSGNISILELKKEIEDSENI